MKLIDKDKVAGEIEERLHKYEQEYEELAPKKDVLYLERIISRAKIDMCKEILSFINTMETKNV